MQKKKLFGFRVKLLPQSVYKEFIREKRDDPHYRESIKQQTGAATQREKREARAEARRAKLEAKGAQVKKGMQPPEPDPEPAPPPQANESDA